MQNNVHNVHRFFGQVLMETVATCDQDQKKIWTYFEMSEHHQPHGISVRCGGVFPETGNMLYSSRINICRMKGKTSRVKKGEKKKKDRLHGIKSRQNERREMRENNKTIIQIQVWQLDTAYLVINLPFLSVDIYITTWISTTFFACV